MFSVALALNISVCEGGIYPTNDKVQNITLTQSQKKIERKKRGNVVCEKGG
jgi:hypothetical protein